MRNALETIAALCRLCPRMYLKWQQIADRVAKPKVTPLQLLADAVYTNQDIASGGKDELGQGQKKLLHELKQMIASRAEPAHAVALDALAKTFFRSFPAEDLRECRCR